MADQGHKPDSSDTQVSPAQAALLDKIGAQASYTGTGAESTFDKLMSDLTIAGTLAGTGAAFAPALGLGGAAGAGAADAGTAGTIGSSAAGDIALTDATAGIGDLAAANAGAAASEAGLGGIGAAGGVGATAALPAADYTLPEVTSLGTSTAGGSALGDLATGAGAGMGLGDLALQAAGTAPGLASAQPQDFSQSFASNTSSFLPATSDSSMQGLSPDFMQSLGINPVGEGSIDPSLTDVSSLADDNPGFGPDLASNIAPQTTSQSLQGWLKNPKNMASLGMMGLSGIQGLSKPKLPAAASTANANANALSKTALPVIQSGGTATPQWQSQKASIDATIDEQIRQQSESLQQAAANSGMGNQNSGVVQQQIAEMTRQANLQRQQLYQQAQQQNVQNAVSELTGADQVLGQIAAMQLQQQEQARAAAAQTAELALLLESGTKWPGTQPQP